MIIVIIHDVHDYPIRMMILLYNHGLNYHYGYMKHILVLMYDYYKNDQSVITLQYPMMMYKMLSDHPNMIVNCVGLNLTVTIMMLFTSI
jgi:hypothetical protein